MIVLSTWIGAKVHREGSMFLSSSISLLSLSCALVGKATSIKGCHWEGNVVCDWEDGGVVCDWEDGRYCRLNATRASTVSIINKGCEPCCAVFCLHALSMP